MPQLVQLTGVVSTQAISLNGVTGAQQVTMTGTVAQSGPAGADSTVPGPPGTTDYNALSNKPTIPTVPTNISAFTNDASYATTTALTTGLATKANSSHTHPQSDISNLVSDLAGKQNTLVSGTTIKTINSISLLGSGDIAISGGGTYTDEQAQDAVGTILTDTSTVDLTYNDAANTISASVIQSALTLAQSQVTNLTSDLAAKQPNITLTTTGTSGAATFIGATLNIPQYSGGGAAGISRSVTSLATNTTLSAAASTDYVIFATGTITLTLPTAVGNTNRYSIENIGTGVVTVNTTSSQTINGETSQLLYQYDAADFISNNTNWGVF